MSKNYLNWEQAMGDELAQNVTSDPGPDPRISAVNVVELVLACNKCLCTLRPLAAHCPRIPDRLPVRSQNLQEFQIVVPTSLVSKY